MRLNAFDVVGIGLGPSNLSAAALLEPLPEVESLFLEAREVFAWHPGMLLPGTTLQSSHLKDLATPADPRSAYTFLNYLYSKKRLYRFLIADFPSVTRAEFDDYLRWASERLSSTRFGARVQEVHYEQNWGEWSFRVCHTEGEVLARHLILGSGQAPSVPTCARPHLGRTVFHASEFTVRDPAWAGLRVAVVGGGQTGAEVVSQLLRDSADLPAELTWVTRRPGLLPLDESAFTNELYTPSYADHFYELSSDRRSKLLEEQKLASDGAKAELLQDLYRRLYCLDHLEGMPLNHRVLPYHELVNLEPCNGSWQLATSGEDGQGTFEADLIILCTGYKTVLPQYLEPLEDQIAWKDGGLVVNRDFSVEWIGAPANRIFVQGMARHARGVQDPNLGLIAWRSAQIVNEIAGECVYDVEDSIATVDWQRERIKESTKSDVRKTGGKPMVNIDRHTKGAPRVGYARDEESTRSVPVDNIEFPSYQKDSVPFYGARFEVGPGCASEPEAHSVRECWMVASGAGELVYDGESIPMRAGDVFLFEPQKSHQARNGGTKPLIVFTVWW